MLKKKHLQNSFNNTQMKYQKDWEVSKGFKVPHEYNNCPAISDISNESHFKLKTGLFLAKPFMGS